MPGGFGGMDLYVSELENGRWGPPVNLGPGVNTEGHELFPFIHKTGRLYFATDGHLGLGGMDILYVDDKGNGQWSAPENPGFPINTSEDDFSFSINDEGTCGFFSSDRKGGSGRDDIYSFTKMAMPVKVFVFDADTKEPIEGAFVKAEEINKILKTGKDGYVVVEMKFNTCKDFAAEHEGYEKNTKQGCVKDATSSENAIVEIPLSKNLKHSVEGVVFDDATGLPLPDAKVTLIGCNDKPDSVAFVMTDASGRYSFPLEKDCCHKIRGEKDKYFAITTPDTICTKALKENTTYQVNLRLQPTATKPEEKPFEPVVTTEPAKDKPTKPKKDEVVYNPSTGLYEKNGKPYSGKHKGDDIDKGKSKSKFTPSETKYFDDTTAVAYLLHIYYDFDQSFIRDESLSELKKMEKLMKDNPNYIIEISSHTDARGSNNYNNRLSQRRAESVVRWLVQHGIERDRLVPRGYGEGMTSNKCINNIPCSEKEHQMNRRTEFRVLGCKDCADKDKIKSAPNEKARIDKCHGCPF
jgi:outer membrane protein OmpA-like peptidoglycan-associated protein